MKVVVFGATGMVGIEVVHHCLEDDRMEHVVTIGRRPTGVVHPKLTEVTHTDFLDYARVESVLASADLCLHCLGVYQGMVPKETFWMITCDYFKALVDTLERVAPRQTLCLFSAQGADPTEQSRLLFARAKGHAENRLTSSSLPHTYIFRPGYINPGRRAAKTRVPSWMVRPFFLLIPSIGIAAPDLARVMIHVGVEGSKQTVFENPDIRRIAQALMAET